MPRPALFEEGYHARFEKEKDYFQIRNLVDDFVLFKSNDESMAKYVGKEIAVLDRVQKGNGMVVTFVEDDEVYYPHNDPEEYYTWYKTDLNFSKKEELFEDPMRIFNHTKDYCIIEEWKGYGVLSESCLYSLDTGKSIPLGEQVRNVVISGEYIYYTKQLTDEEIENDPNKEYFLWEDPEGDRTITKQTTNARIFRRQIGSDEEELVFQMFYQGVPVFISNYYVDGECLWMEIKNHEQYRNYFNPTFGSREPHGRPEDRPTNESKEPQMRSYLLMVDLHSGTVRFIELEDMEEIQGIW